MNNSFQKKTLCVGITAAILGCSTAVNAKDWSGAYVGASLGNNSFSGSASNLYGETTEKSSGIIYGLNGGYNFQSGTTVFGVEADYSQGNMSENSRPTYPSYYRHEASWDWYSSVRGRIGLANDNTLVYLTGGLAWADTNYTYCYNSTCSSNSYNAHSTGKKSGMVSGLGIESMLNDHFSMRAEYDNIDLDTTDAYRINKDPIKFNSSSKLLRLGVNYKF